MRKLFSIVLSASLALPLAACAESADSSSPAAVQEQGLKFYKEDGADSTLWCEVIVDGTDIEVLSINDGSSVMSVWKGVLPSENPEGTVTATVAEDATASWISVPAQEYEFTFDGDSISFTYQSIGGDRPMTVTRVDASDAVVSTYSPDDTAF